MSSDEKKLRLSKISYQAFLRDVVHTDDATIAFYQSRTRGWWGVGIDAISALDCWGIGLPGFKGMNLQPGSIARMGYTPAGFGRHRRLGGRCIFPTETRRLPGCSCAT